MYVKQEGPKSALSKSALLYKAPTNQKKSAVKSSFLDFSACRILENHSYSKCKIYGERTLMQRLSQRVALFFGYAKKVNVSCASLSNSDRSWNCLVLNKKQLGEACLNSFSLGGSSSKIKCERVAKYFFKAIKNEAVEDRKKEFIRQLLKDPLFQESIWKQLQKKSEKTNTRFYEVLKEKFKGTDTERSIEISCNLENGDVDDFIKYTLKREGVLEQIAEVLFSRQEYSIFKNYKI